MGSWIDQELAGFRFADARLGKRFGVLLKQLSDGLGRTIPLACGDWAATKAAYRFLDNDRVGEAMTDAGGTPMTVTLDLKYDRLRVCPPIGKEKRYRELDLTVIHAIERHPAEGRDPIEWKLITNMPIRNRSDAIEKLEWYAQRWKIETFHEVMKSGCRAEESKLRSAERLANLLAMMCILAWRTLWLTMLNRTSPDLPAKLVFTDVEMQLLTHVAPTKDGSKKPTVGEFLIRLARLGGYLNRARDSPPGNMVFWRGIDLPPGT